GLLKSVTPPSGGKVTFTYAPSTSYPNVDDSGNPQMSFVKQVVSRIDADDGYGQIFTTRYDYQGGLYDLAKGEFRGFKKVSVTSPENIRSDTYFHQRDELKGEVDYSETYGSDGNLYSKTINYYATNFAYPTPPCPSSALSCLQPYSN